MKTVPVPGEVLRTTVFMGLTFDELLILGSVPMVAILPSLFIQEIPLVVSIASALVVALGVIVVAIQTPDGQTPVEWAPAAMRRRFSPSEYYLKPKEPPRDEGAYLNVVRTAEAVKAGEDPGDATLVAGSSRRSSR